MFYHTEAKPQCWRAVAVFEDGGERLVYLGRSAPQVRAGFGPAFFAVLDGDERDGVTSVVLQHWEGAPDAGRWVHQAALTVPGKAKLARSA